MHLTLFFTYKTSLERWDSVGMLDREIALYRNYLRKGIAVSFVTYGKNDHSLFRDRLAGIEILCNERKLPTRLYATLIPLLHAHTLRKTDIVKTNQTPGGLLALSAAKLFGKPLLARCGYMHSEFIANRHGEGSREALRALGEENRLFRSASHIEVTTPAMKESILSRMPGTGDRISVIPNYVDTGAFKPLALPKEIDLLFIGRLVAQKNLFALLEALQGLDIRTTVIGSGSQEKKLKAKARARGMRVEWIDNVPNNELPCYLDRSKIFILPSLYEGHPKTLIEAMACGVAVIGADSPGIREILRDGETGLLCSTKPEGIRNAVEKLMRSANLRERLGENAREFALKHYSLEHIAETELALLGKLRQ
ncbi:hypothetical protein CHL67_01940 [Prosthecochloris sp. GSB1]|uniref:glycosyltransferase family 4 protein n=1 Tax=Prosthecochloris sp. GSB1 TaxID=281093 RepID=UPI000B8CFD94|nr:glycosyltransferase family 4 protein [Prosthecochloris sp. GSB1]ASQ89844.1 hypothetical protein CHL67_01940 [Prosthecochloris sp. GSB1]